MADTERARAPTPSVVISVAVDKALQDLAAVVYSIEVRSGTSHQEAVTKSQALASDAHLRTTLVAGLDHARTLEKKQATAQLEKFAERLGTVKLELERALEENKQLRRENYTLKDPRRE